MQDSGSTHATGYSVGARYHDERETNDLRHLAVLREELMRWRTKYATIVKVSRYLVCPDKHIVFLPSGKKKSWASPLRMSKLQDAVDEYMRSGKPIPCPICGKQSRVMDVDPPEEITYIYSKIKSLEKYTVERLESRLQSNPVWRNYLSKVRGIGPVFGAFLLSILDPARFDTIPKLWRYSGLHVVHVCPRCGYRSSTRGRCPSCRIELRGSAPRHRSGEKLDFSMNARVYLWKISKSLALNGGIYRSLFEEIYREEERKGKARGLTKSHIYSRALRRLAKIFVSHYWIVSRIVTGLPIDPSSIPFIKSRERFIPPLVDMNHEEFYEAVIKPLSRILGDWVEIQWMKWIEKTSRDKNQR